MIKNNDELSKNAHEVMKNNDKSFYTIPAAGLYPYQWNWDSAFAAWGFSEFDMDRAWLELETLFDSQWENGMVPHIIFHGKDDGYFPGPDVWQSNKNPDTSGITQPPVALSMAKRLYEKDPVLGKVKIEKLFKPMMKWIRWFMDNRAESGAIALIHPWESGRDNAPDWDGALKHIDTSKVGEYVRRDTLHIDQKMRPKKENYDCYLALLYFGRDNAWDEKTICDKGGFRVADIGTTFILLRACLDMIWFADQLSFEEEYIKELADIIEVLNKGVASLWNPDLESYDSYDLLNKKFTGSISVASFLCWYAGIKNDKMLKHLHRIMSKVRYAIPSYDPELAGFEPYRYWRGSVWLFFNALVALGLEEQSYEKETARIRKDTKELLAKGGFYEYFNPETAEGLGGNHFTWTAATWLSWASKKIKEVK